MIHLIDTTKQHRIRCNRWTRKVSYEAFKTEDATKVTCSGCLGKKRAPNRYPPNPRTLKVGDILHASWGYDQTNANFFQVIRLIGSTQVELREIASKSVQSEMTYDLVVPIKDQFLKTVASTNKESVIKTASGDRVKVYEFASARLWDGRPCHETNPMFGH